MKVKEQLWVEEDDNMALCPPSKAAFDGVSEGPHVAICDMVIDLGMQDGTFGLKHQIYIRFEVPGERIKYTDESGVEREGPKCIGKRYGFTLGEKATLRKDLESWRGKAFLDSELMDDQGNPIYDVSKVVGKPCQIGVIKNDKGTSKIATIMGVPKGFPIPVPENELIVYDADNQANLSKLPKWMQEALGETQDTLPAAKQADSYGHVNQQVPAHTTAPGGDFIDDDIPF